MIKTVGNCGRIRARRATAIALVALAAPAAAAAEPAAPEGSPSAQLDQAVAALTSPDPTSVHPTEELRDLAAVLPQLQGAERRRARALLARPPANNDAGLGDAGSIEPFGAEWSQAATASRESFTSPGGDFIVHYVTVGGDAPELDDDGGVIGVPDYVEQVAARADTSAAVQNGVLGWPEPKSDGSRGGGDGLTDIYLSDICGPSSCLFGYAGPDDGSEQCSRPPFKCFAYLVLDNDYAPAEFDYPDPDIPLSVTVAHEYNHVLQFAIDAMQDGWMFESTAVWSEEHVFGEADDWLFYVDIWKRRPDVSITQFGGQGGLRVYGTAVWNHWLELGAGYGPGVILDAWEQSRKTTPKDFGVGAFHRAIKQNGGRGFEHEFGRFATATAEWRILNGDFPGAPEVNSPPDAQEFKDVERDGRLRRDRGKARFELDHASYRLFRVEPRRANVIKLKVRAPRKLRIALALVGRDGSPLGGTATKKFDYARRGGKQSVRLRGVKRFERITAVVVNADARVRGFDGGGRHYKHDNERFTAAIR